MIIIDEAYAFDDSGYGKDVINSMLTYTTNPNIAVILLGYPSEMEKMMRDQNPGFRGRFDWERRFIFEDYGKDELDAIVYGLVDGKDGVTMTRSVRRKLAHRLAAMRDSVPNFRNAAEAKAMLDQVLARARSRQTREGIASTDVTITQVDLTTSEEADLLSAGPLAPLKSLMRMEVVQEKLEVGAFSSPLQPCVCILLRAAVYSSSRLQPCVCLRLSTSCCLPVLTARTASACPTTPKTLPEHYQHLEEPVYATSLQARRVYLHGEFGNGQNSSRRAPRARAPFYLRRAWQAIVADVQVLESRGR